jgi:hypothetical protein
MPELADIFRRYGSIYLEKFSGLMLPSHKRALNDISKCRTGAFGAHIDACDRCGYTHLFYHSCSNRSCPKCHHIHGQKWLEKRQRQLLPVKYFHVVFTLPDGLRYLVRSNQTKLLDCLVKAAAYALFKLMADSRYAGGIPGMLCVIHTWTNTMLYHPHAHFLIPAVVVSQDGTEWLPIKKKKYLVPVQNLSVIFRARFVKLARKLLSDKKLPPSIFKHRWVVYSKPYLKGGHQVLQYLARYIYRIAITNHRILADNNGMVTFRYKNSNSSKWKKMTLPALEFMRRFLQHVLPKGFHKVRYYGFLSSKYRHIFNSLMLMITNSKRTTKHSQNYGQNQILKADSYRKCPICKTGNMVVMLHIFHQKNSLLFVRPPP